MDKKLFLSIYSCIIFKIYITILLFQSTISAPTNLTITYDKFLENITRDECAFPDGIVLPFKKSDTTFEYFAKPLRICMAPDATKRPREANMLCNEVYDALKNITCQPNKNVQFPEIKIDFSNKVCEDISAFKLKHSLEEQSFMHYLAEKFVCEIMCEDDFLSACQVLLWSYQLNKRINDNSNLNNDFPEEPNTSPDEKIATKQENNEDTHGLLSKKPNEKDELPLQKSTTKVKNNEELSIGKDLLSMKNDLKEPVIVKTVSEEGKEKNLSIIGNPPVSENEIDIGKKPVKVTVLSKTINTNKPVLDEKKEPPKDLDKTEPKEDQATLKNNLQPEAQNEIDSVKQILVTNNNVTANASKPVTGGVTDKLNKSHDTVLNPSILTKTSDPEPNEAKVLIKPEATPKENAEVTDAKIIPTVAKEDISSPTAVADLEKMEDGNRIPMPAEKEPDYNDVENEGEYSKIDYGEDEDGFYVTSMKKKVDESDAGKIPRPAIAENEPPKYDVFPPRNSFGRGPDDIQVIPAFPEQEDSHFFFYFLSLVLILMAGYLLFHNKQKIIALIVEGRHERRRRVHGVGYKKLETK